MPFYIIESSGTSIVSKRQLQLAGNNFIYKTWLSLGSPSQGWVAQNAFITKELKNNITTTNDLRILISTTNYDFFVDEIWGWTYKDNNVVQWTPLLLVGTEVVIKEEKNNYELQKNHLYQFMYLQGETGGWIFGAGGPNTSPLLFDDTFDWFRRAIKK
jgi:hypothetical protein